MAYLYYPGCQYSAQSPENSEKIKTYLQQRFHMQVPGCCRTNDELLQPGDTAVCICPTCLANLEKSAPHAKATSVWEVLADDSHFPWPDFRNVPITLQDCRDTQKNRKLQEAVRTILSRMNVQIVETDTPFEKANFCRPRTEEQLAAVKQHCKKMTTAIVVGYCTGCVKGLQAGGKQGVHLMDLIMDSVK